MTVSFYLSLSGRATMRATDQSGPQGETESAREKTGESGIDGAALAAAGV
jgi:hypothetical protein